jgi:hypothetical protein
MINALLHQLVKGCITKVVLRCPQRILPELRAFYPASQCNFFTKLEILNRFGKSHFILKDPLKRTNLFVYLLHSKTTEAI